MDRTRWVPITMSTIPLRRSSRVFFCWDGVQNRLSISTRTGKSFMRWTCLFWNKEASVW